MVTKWIALFSQSGSELAGICKNLGVCPDIIFTNNSNLDSLCADIQSMPRLAYMKSQSIHDVLSINYAQIITMHGYTRILPKPITDQNFVINGHPGDIIKYPELKGKDPQQKAIDLGLRSTGVVIHRASEELDSGEIMSFRQVIINEKDTVESLSLRLKEVSINMWTDVMKDVLYKFKASRAVG